MIPEIKFCTENLHSP